MIIEHMNDEQLNTCIKTLERAKANRPGGLLQGEQIALDNLKADAERRADIAYCKAHDC